MGAKNGPVGWNGLIILRNSRKVCREYPIPLQIARPFSAPSMKLVHLFAVGQVIFFAFLLGVFLWQSGKCLSLYLKHETGTTLQIRASEDPRKVRGWQKNFYYIWQLETFFGGKCNDTFNVNNNCLYLEACKNNLLVISSLVYCKFLA